MSEALTPFHEWFEPNSVQHVTAMAHYLERGTWPQYFIPADVEMNDNYIRIAERKIVAAWIAQKTSVATRYAPNNQLDNTLEFGGLRRPDPNLVTSRRSEDRSGVSGQYPG